MADRRPHVVIVGGGFGGLYAARELARMPVRVTLVDRTNHHLFQPLLYQAATATLAPTDITAPIRYLLRDASNTTVLMAEVNSIDPVARQVRCDDGATMLDYDYLILAAGARHSYFGHPEWESAAPGLKSIDDAIVIRQRFLSAFERAEKSGSAKERDAWLTFVIVGGGPTGVELAGMFPTIARRTFERDFRHIDASSARVILVEGGPRILPSFNDVLASRAHRDLEELGVEIRTSTIVTGIEKGWVTIGDERIATGTIIWAAGNVASPLGASLGVPLDRAGRVIVNEDLSVPGHPEIFVVGDQAAIPAPPGQPVPGVAPAAMQGGPHAAKNVRRRIERLPTRPFRYVNKGDMATIGRHRAIARVAGVNLVGIPAWFFWLFLHILYLAGFRNRLSVLVEWGYAFLTYQRGARMITAPRGSPEGARTPIGPW